MYKDSDKVGCDYRYESIYKNTYESLEDNQNVYFLLEDWMYDLQDLICIFDYILIASNPSPNTIILNALAVSHALMSPVNADDKTQDAVPETEAVLEDLKEKTYDKRRDEARVTCEHFLVADNYDCREKLSRNFFEKVNGKTYNRFGSSKPSHVPLMRISATLRLFPRKYF